MSLSTNTGNDIATVKNWIASCNRFADVQTLNSRIRDFVSTMYIGADQKRELDKIITNRIAYLTGEPKFIECNGSQYLADDNGKIIECMHKIALYPAQGEYRQRGYILQPVKVYTKYRLKLISQNVINTLLP